MARGTFVLRYCPQPVKARPSRPFRSKNYFYHRPRSRRSRWRPAFDFQPYDCGPFDSQVYVELDKLGARGLVQIYHTGHYRIYSWSHEGYRQGYAALKTLPGPAVSYIREVAIWVRQLNFQQLVAVIYPEMRANRIFNQ
jgi:hypothetical protein